MTTRLRLRAHRATTAHLASVHPWSSAIRPSLVDAPLVGVDVLGAATPYRWDPFSAYSAGLVANPNVWVLGEPGHGKSCLVKSLLWRCHATATTPPWIAIIDPKGEYGPLAEALGLTTVRLAPGGAHRLNPIAPATDADGTLRRARTVTALVATVLGRSLTGTEDAALFDAVAHVDARATLVDVARRLAEPEDGALRRLRLSRGEVEDASAPLRFALDKILNRSLRGMFDGQDSIRLDQEGPGVVVDLSGVGLESDALALVMTATAAWLTDATTESGRRRVQVFDEAWALLANAHTASYLQHCFKLGRSLGVANVCVAHRVSDLAAQSDDGTSTAKIAAGLLADAATKIVLRQAPDQLGATATAIGLTPAETDVVGRLARGRALWHVGADVAVVQHILSPAEAAMFDTDARMRDVA